jgi:hypothetical protein
VPPPHVLSHPVVCVGVSLSLSLSLSLHLPLSRSTKHAQRRSYHTSRTVKAIRLEHKACTMDESGTGEGFPTAGFIFVGSYPFTNNPPAKPAT